jgi:hypothetical protein
MIVNIYDAKRAVFERERPRSDRREFVVEVKGISVNVEKLFIDGEEVSIGEKDLILVDASSVHFIEENFDKERGIPVYKEAHIYTRTFSLKEAFRDALDEAQYIVTWVVRPPE